MVTVAEYSAVFFKCSRKLLSPYLSDYRKMRLTRQYLFSIKHTSSVVLRTARSVMKVVDLVPALLFKVD